MIALPCKDFKFLKTIHCIAIFWAVEAVSLCGSDNAVFEGPPGAKFVFGDEFSGAELNQEIWGLGINKKNL